VVSNGQTLFSVVELFEEDLCFPVLLCAFIAGLDGNQGYRSEAYPAGWKFFGSLLPSTGLKIFERKQKCLSQRYCATSLSLQAKRSSLFWISYLEIVASRRDSQGLRFREKVSVLVKYP
jgi:hypothetical protein